jgi:glutathione S-transferase
MVRIWGRPTSSCTERVLWALVEIGLPYELTLSSLMMGPDGHVSKGGKPYGVIDTPKFLAMNPNGTVPVIDDEGVILWDSNAILAYLALQHAPEKLYLGDVKTFALATQWMCWANERLEPPLHTLVMELYRLPQSQRDSAAAEAARKAMLRPLEILDEHLAGQPYVASESFTIGDIPAGVAYHRWLMFDLERPEFPHIDAWHERLSGREGFRQHVEPREYHIGG